ncbi:MAG TPA: hypothetical protein VF867_11980 [Arthrobacter sp.]
MFSLINPAPRKEVMEQFQRAVAELPEIEPGRDHRHDEIRGVLVEVARGGHPEKGTFRDQARRAGGRLHEHLLNLATMGGTRLQTQVVPGAILHFFYDGLTDDQTFGRGHRRVLEVTDFNFSFVVMDGEKAGMTGTYFGDFDPESSAPFLQPSSECGPDCHRGQ